VVSSPNIEVSKWALGIVNNVYEIERKLVLHGDSAQLSRNVNRLKELIKEMGLIYEDPFGQPFKETRTDLEASISGASTENLHVTEVIKPIIREAGGLSMIVQKGIVIVEEKRTTE
jgi:hypothetical protein